MAGDEEFIRRLKSIKSLAHNIILEIGASNKINRKELEFWKDISNGIENIIRLYTDDGSDDYLAGLLLGRSKHE